VPKPLQICLWSRSKSKNRDKQLTHIVRVKGRAALKVSSYESCYFELEIITMQEFVDFGAFFKVNRSRDKIVKADIN
jgi:hypothetical protein